ncbi:MAG: hypothetical protein V1765_01105 [bacterium]
MARKRRNNILFDYFESENIDPDQYSDKEIETLISLENPERYSIFQESEEDDLGDEKYSTNY